MSHDGLLTLKSAFGVLDFAQVLRLPIDEIHDVVILGVPMAGHVFLLARGLFVLAARTAESQLPYESELRSRFFARLLESCIMKGIYRNLGGGSALQPIDIRDLPKCPSRAIHEIIGGLF